VYARVENNNAQGDKQLQTVLVKHGQPTQAIFVSTPWTAVNANLIAGVPLTFTAVARDQYNNIVTTNELQLNEHNQKELSANSRLIVDCLHNAHD